MELRVSNARPQGPFTSNIGIDLRRQKPVFTYQPKDFIQQNIYYEKNPYLLQVAPS